MKILHTVQLYEPHKGGSEEVVKQISERLAARGHEVTVATGASPIRTFTELNGVKIREFHVSGNAAAGSAGDALEYLEFLRSWDGDLMLNYAAQIWSTDLVLDLLPELPFNKVLVPCGYSGLHRPLFKRYFAELPAKLQNYDALIYMSRNYQDFEFGERHALGDKAVIIPNGASEEEFAQEATSFRERYRINTPHMVLTVSNHYEAKGHRHFRDAAEKVPDATFVIIGNPEEQRKIWKGCYLSCKLASVRSPRIKCFRSVPREDVVQAFHAADVFALTSDIECAPVVIYEAMASGTPFVSFRCGNVVDNAEYGTVIDNADELAPAISSLLTDPLSRSEIGKRGRDAWASNFTWERITDQYESLYQRITGKS